MTLNIDVVVNTNPDTEKPEVHRAGQSTVAPRSSLVRDTGESAQGELRRDAAWRHNRVAIAAYYISERRGFESGFEARDWRLAELQTDAVDEAAE